MIGRYQPPFQLPADRAIPQGRPWDIVIHGDFGLRHPKIFHQWSQTNTPDCYLVTRYLQNTWVKDWTLTKNGRKEWPVLAGLGLCPLSLLTDRHQPSSFRTVRMTFALGYSFRMSSQKQKVGIPMTIWQPPNMLRKAFVGSRFCITSFHNS